MFKRFQRRQRMPFHRIVLVLGIVEDEVQFVVHCELRMTLKGDDVMPETEVLVATEFAGGKGCCPLPPVASPNLFVGNGMLFGKSPGNVSQSRMLMMR